MRYYESFRIEDFQETFDGSISIRECLSLIFDNTATILGNSLLSRQKTVQAHLDYYDSNIIEALVEYFDAKRNIEGYEFRIGPTIYANEYSFLYEQDYDRKWRILNGVVLHSA